MRRAFVAALVATALFLAQPAAAQGLIPTTDTSAPTPPRAALSQQFVNLGLTDKEAEARVSQLTDAEVSQLVENPKQVGMGGIQDKTLIIIAVILIIPSVLFLAIL